MYMHERKRRHLCKPSTPKPETALNRPPILFQFLGAQTPQPQSPNGKTLNQRVEPQAPKGSFFGGRDITWSGFLGG